MRPTAALAKMVGQLVATWAQLVATAVGLLAETQLAELAMMVAMMMEMEVMVAVVALVWTVVVMVRMTLASTLAATMMMAEA